MTDKEIDNLLEEDSKTMLNDLRPKLKMQLAKEEINKENKNMVFDFKSYQEDVQKLRNKIVDAIQKGISVQVNCDYEVQQEAFDKELFNEAYENCVIEKKGDKGIYIIRPKK